MNVISCLLSEITKGTKLELLTIVGKAIGNNSEYRFSILNNETSNLIKKYYYCQIDAFLYCIYNLMLRLGIPAMA